MGKKNLVVVPPSSHSNEYLSSGTSPTRRGYRIAEAAEYMGVSPWFIELKIRSKELRALKMCRHYTIFKEDMDAFLDAERNKAARPTRPLILG